MTLRIYNTLTRKKEVFQPLEAGKVRMYVCGPTVYDNAHVGHAMSSVVFDIIRRYLEFQGYQVKHVMNFTDVDDKIIQRARETGEDPFRLAARYVESYKQHLQDLNILPPHLMPQVTQEIDHIIAIIQELIFKEYAYVVDGDVYFRVAEDEDYGKLSRRKLEDMQAGARIEVDERKQNPLDFALWKAAKPGEPAWDSPWGKGRPGWHIECSTMCLAHLGEQIDIHGGGNDLIFPHHENEIAQSESYTGKPFARYWVHNGMLQFSGEKMSKSLGNIVSIDEFLSQHEADVFRLIVLNSSYRSPLTFNQEVIEHARRGLERLHGGLRPARPGNAPASAEGNTARASALEVLSIQMKATRRGFTEAMDDDFNTAGALSHLFDLVRTINQARDAGVDDAGLAPAQALLRELAGVLGLTLHEPKSDTAAAPFVDLLIQVRSELRRQKLWALADQIRDQLAALGVVLEDTQNGTTWRWE